MAEPMISGSFGLRARCVLAPNPGPMTLDGTNTWILGEPGARRVAVVDPGPADEGHLLAVLAEVVSGDAWPAVVLLTHGHPDHSAGASRFSELAGHIPVRALDPAHRLGGEGLAGGDRLDVRGLDIEVVATPGHTADSLCFALPADHAVLTGDTVLGRGTTVVAHPDGRLEDYLRSLHMLAALAAERELRRVLPGHGPVLNDPPAVIAAYLRHRQTRLEQVRAAVADGARTPQDVVRAVYADVDESLWPAAELSVAAQLEYLGVGST